MEVFETGKRYIINGGGEITVLKRTRCYVTYQHGNVVRRVIIDKAGWFGLGELIWIAAENTTQLARPCFADSEVNLMKGDPK